MKFVTISWPVSVLHKEAPTAHGYEDRTETGTLSVTISMSDNATTEDALRLFGEKLDNALKLVDLGDEE